MVSTNLRLSLCDTEQGFLQAALCILQDQFTSTDLSPCSANAFRCEALNAGEEDLLHVHYE